IADGTVFVEQCTVSGFSLNGIVATAGKLLVRDTVSRNNGTGLSADSTGSDLVSLKRSRFEGNTYGISSGYATHIPVANGPPSGSSVYGAQVLAGHNGTISLERSRVTHNPNTGLYCDFSTTGRIRAARLLVYDNGKGFDQGGGSCQFDSLVNNVVRGN